VVSKSQSEFRIQKGTVLVSGLNYSSNQKMAGKLNVVFVDAKDLCTDDATLREDEDANKPQRKYRSKLQSQPWFQKPDKPFFKILMDKRRTQTTTTASFNWAFANTGPQKSTGGPMKERNYRKKLERQPWWKNTDKPFFRTLYSKHTNTEQVDTSTDSNKPKEPTTVVISSNQPQEELSNQFLAAAFENFNQLKNNRRAPTNKG